MSGGGHETPGTRRRAGWRRSPRGLRQPGIPSPQPRDAVTSVTHRTGHLFVATSHDLRHATGLRRSLAFECELVGGLDAAGDVVDAEHLHTETKVGTDRHGRHET